MSEGRSGRGPAERTLSIDMTRCQGRGVCIELLAGRLGRDQWGYPWGVDAQGRGSTEVPLAPEDLQEARSAVKLCPVSALRLR